MERICWSCTPNVGYWCTYVVAFLSFHTSSLSLGYNLSSPFVAGEGDITRKLVEPIKVFSDKDLLREKEKAVSTLQPDNEWSIRITAMQRVEGLVLGGS